MIRQHGSGKNLHLCLRNEGLRLFLAALLQEWGFTIWTTCPESPEELLLTDGSCRRCADHPKRINLTSAPDHAGEHVTLPILPEVLWRTLEKYFHCTPRHYLRLVVDYPITMKIRGQEQAGQFHSLSAAGGRLSLPRELATGEIIPILLPLPSQTLHLQGKVIYVMTFPDRHHRYDAGVLFERIAAVDKALLHDAILLTFLSNTRSKLPHWAFASGIDSCELSPALRQQL